MIQRRLLAAALSILVTGAVAAARADDDSTSGRGQLDKILAVLRLHTEAASKACLSAMTEVHETEKQVAAHQNDAANHTDLDIAHDVLESDYQNSSQICGADAARVCRNGATGPLAAPCAAIQTVPPQ
ncbi:hypothetical protein [Lichenicola sp.]|uniref:hypothetical protein n=1 Tax=Lichenicola sp. TaxID=2804529 RepID=UPI003B00CE81